MSTTTATTTTATTTAAAAAFASSLKQSKKHLHNLAKTMKWPHSKGKFTTTFENRVTLVNKNSSHCEITVTDNKGPPALEGRVIFMQCRVTGDIDDDDEVVSQGFWKKLLQGRKQLMERN